MSMAARCEEMKESGASVKGSNQSAIKSERLQLTKLYFAFVKRTIGRTGFFPVLFGSIKFVRMRGDFAMSSGSKKLFMTLMVEKDRWLIVDGKSRPAQIIQRWFHTSSMITYLKVPICLIKGSIKLI